MSGELRAFQPRLWGQTFGCDECIAAGQTSIALVASCGPVEIVEEDRLGVTRLKLRWPGHSHDGHVLRIFTADKPKLLAMVYRSTPESVDRLYKDTYYVLPLCQECLLQAGLAASIRPTRDWLYILRDDAAHVLISLGDDTNVGMHFHIGHAVGQHTDLDMCDAAVPTVVTAAAASPKPAADVIEKLRYRAFFGDIVARRKLAELGDKSSWK